MKNAELMWLDIKKKFAGNNHFKLKLNIRLPSIIMLGNNNDAIMAYIFHSIILFPQ